MKQLDLACTYNIAQDELEILGSALSLQQLVELLKSDKDEMVSLSSSPYPNILSGDLLTRLGIKITCGNAVVEAKDNAIMISGSVKGLTLLSKSIQNLFTPANRMNFSSKHAHLEYFPDHPFIAPESKSLVVYLME